MATKLLVLTHNFPRYAGDYSGIFLSLLTRQLTNHNIQPIVLAPADNEASPLEVIDNVKIIRFAYQRPGESSIAYRGNMQEVLSTPKGIAAFLRFLSRFENAASRVISGENIDVIAGHWLVPAGIVMKRIMRKIELPMLMSSHGTDIRLGARFPLGVRLYFRPLFERLHAWTVVSNFLMAEASKILPNFRHLIEVLPMPQDGSLFYQDPTVPRTESLVVSVTRYTKQKRVDVLLQAFSQVASQFPQARLSIYGSGALRMDIEAQIDRLHLRDHVTLHAPVPQDDLRFVYNHAAIVVLNSYNEGFGLALTEAMLCGTAVIGSSSGGITDIIKDGQTGILVPVDNSTALAEAILGLLKDNHRRKQLAHAGMNDAIARFASGAAAKRYAELVHSAAESR